MASKFISSTIESKPDVNIDIECIGRKGRDFMRRDIRWRRRDPPMKQLRWSDGRLAVQPDAAPKRAGRVQIVGEYVGVLGKLDYNFANTLSEKVVASYSRGEIDGVYILFNEFKSVIAQRLVPSVCCPSRKSAKSISTWRRKLRKRSASRDWKQPRRRASASAIRHHCRRRGSRQVRDRASRLHLRAAAGRIVPRNFAQIYRHPDFPCVIRIGSRRTRRAHDGHGRGHH